MALPTPVILWNDLGISSAPDPIRVDNLGTYGPSSDLADIKVGGGGSVTRSTRNGLPTWTGNPTSASLQVPGTPATDLPAPFTVYFVLSPAFVDTNERMALSFAFNNGRIVCESTGFGMWINGAAGIFDVGGPIQTDGRVYVLECVSNGVSSSIRVLDDQGADVTVLGAMGNSGVRAQSLGWYEFASELSLNGEYCETEIVSGVGSTIDRNQKIQDLLAKWGTAVAPVEGDGASTLADLTAVGSGTAPNVADGASTLADVTMVGAGTLANAGDAAATLDDVTSAGLGSVALTGIAVATLQPVTMQASGQIASPGPAPLVPPRDPSFLNILKHLLPRARAWRITEAKRLREYVEGFSQTGDDVKSEADLAWLDYFPATTRRLAEWVDQFGLQTNNLSESQVRAKLDAAWKATGSQSPEYLQGVLQANGFPVYVHQWWVPGTEPAIGVKACATARDPRAHLSSAPGGSINAQMGEAVMQMGESFAQMGNSNASLGYTLVNIIESTSANTSSQMGEPGMQMGEPLAQMGAYTDFQTSTKEYLIPNDPDKFPYFYYVGGQTFPDLVNISSTRRAELEALILKYGPTHLWCGVMVNYN